MIALIDQIPSPEEIQEKMEALEDDEDGYTKYYLELQKQVLEAFEAYEALTEEQQKEVTNAEKLLQMDWMKAETLESPEGVMGPDEAYVNNISIISMTTGTVPFDDKEGRGNDISAEDDIVRTYDNVTYNFEVEMKPWEESKTFSEARVKLEFVLPRTETEAVFDQSAMAWMDITEKYKPTITTESREIDGKMTDCQVLTCYKLLKPAGDNTSVIPGDFGENLTIYVKSMHEGETFTPIISAAMEGGTWEGGCEKPEHSQVEEKKTIKAGTVKVTAAPKYNIRLQSESSYRDIFDFQGDEDWMANYGESAANTDIENPIPGRLMKLGIVLQLYNDNAAKGLKGIELPEGPISFDLEVSSIYRPTATSEQQGEVDTTNEYTPLLWSYGENREIKYGENNTDGRLLKDERGCLELAPFHKHNEDREGSDCYNSGTWKAIQNGTTISIEVSEYEIDLTHMPTKNLPGGADLYGKHVGCFSSGAIWLVQPFNKKDSDTSADGPKYDIINDHGAGSFSTTVEAKNLKTMIFGGVELEQGKDGFDQMVKEDDREVRTLELNLPGAMQNRVRYAGNPNWWEGSGVKDIYDGNDYATVGDGLYLKGGFSYDSKKDGENQLYLGTNLIRFYGNAIELKGDGRAVLDNGASLDGGLTGNGFDNWQQSGELKKNIRIYYATKEDGTDWKDDYEMEHTHEEDLVFYEDVKKIPDNCVCVGILTCFVGPGPQPESEKDDGYYSFYHEANVRDDVNLVGKAFALVSTSRVWTKQMFEENEISLYDIGLHTGNEKNVQKWIEDSGLLDVSHYTSANIKDSVWYRSETYKEDGSGAIGTHNSEWEHWGDTLLVIGYKTFITKNLMQKVEGEEKQTFNLDNDQRVADFQLQPRTYYEKEGDYKHLDTITIKDILPEYMTYIEGSSYFGGKYDQTDPNGGKQGNIIKDDNTNAAFPEPQSVEPTVSKNADGTQTLTWVIKDVKIGEPMAPIYYSVKIGDEERPENEVPFGTTPLKNVAYITAPGDMRDPLKTAEKHSEAGISVSRGTASSFGKYTKQDVVEEDGAIDYVVYFNNNANSEREFAIMDTMPMHQMNGSKFTGTYTFAEWKIDTAKCDISKIDIYYTFDEKYKGMTTKEIKLDEIKEWEKAVIETDGKIKIPEPQQNQKHPIAWSIIGKLEATKSVYVDLKIQLDPGPSDVEKTENNFYVNILSSGDTITTTKTPTVRRTLEGLTWIDDDRDGLQSANEMKLSGVKVGLLKLVEENGSSMYQPVCYPGTNNPIEIETGQQISVRAKSGEEAENHIPGSYKFRDLPPGVFAVKFSNGNSNISILKATEANVGDNDQIDSDGIASNSGDILEFTEIKDINMPTAEELYKNSIKLYESKYNDSGFYCGADLGLVKKGTGEIPLANVRFKLTDSKGSIVQVDKKDNNGYFVVRETDDSKKWILTGDKEDNYAFKVQGTQSDVLVSNLLDTTVLSDDNLRNEGIRAVSGNYVETDSKGIVNVKGLLPGNYTISELQTAAGYQILEKPIQIKIGTDGRTTVVNPEELDSDVNLDSDNKLIVRNHPLYALPSTGGMGIYWYMFGGVLLMSAAAFITYRNKRREVLRS
ncbi:MAG: LPXTG cell wall anchor domain-containing protein [Lachnospiraceae bacterium]|nr:LPXTG cell wall anchor domain-containing protein [Lachnospiraceae bacterium]